MRSSESLADEPEPDVSKRLARQPGGAAGLTGLLAVTARTLVEAPPDADDGALLAIVGQTVAPALGDVLTLYQADATGAFRLIGAVPADAAEPPDVRESADPHPWLPGEVVGLLGSATSCEGLLAIGSKDPARQYGDAERAFVDALAAIMTMQRAASRQSRREMDLRRRLDSIVLAGRELAHLLNNDLTMPVGVVELLLDRKTYSPDLLEMLRAASHDLAALEQHVRDFHERLREQSIEPRG